jgi:hypothetical protein
VTVPREGAPAHLVSKQDPTQHWVADTGRIRHELGYGEPVSRDEALRRTIAWERAHPPTGGRAQEPDYAAEDAVLAELSRPAC